MPKSKSELLCRILKEIKKNNICGHPILIDKLPFNIEQSNQIYCLNENLELNVEHVALTLLSGVRNVIIHLNNHQLTIHKDQTVISCTNNENIIFSNGSIQSDDALSNTSVLIENSSQLVFDNITFIGSVRALSILSQTDKSKNIRVSNCTFNLTNPSAQTIRMNAINGLIVEDSEFGPGAALGINLRNNALNVNIRRCNFSSQNLRAINIQSLVTGNGNILMYQSSNIFVQECNFYDNVDDVVFLGSSNCHVYKCNFSQTEFSQRSVVFTAGQSNFIITTSISDNLLVDHCNFNSKSYTGLFIQLGGSVDGELGKTAKITNCNFTHKSTDVPIEIPNLFDPISVNNADNVIIDGCIFNDNATGRTLDGHLYDFAGVPLRCANIHIGSLLVKLVNDELIISGGSNNNNIQVRNSVFNGNQTGIYCETGVPNYLTGLSIPNQNITLRDNNISAFETGIQFDNTQASTIENNKLNNIQGNTYTKGNGIVLNAATEANPVSVSNFNILSNNNLSNNTGTGIKVYSINNILNNNKLINNLSGGICAVGNNTLTDNITINNGICQLNLTNNADISDNINLKKIAESIVDKYQKLSTN
jgi:hypothetical protein